MFRQSPEIAIICVASGLFLIGRGWYSLRKRTIKVRKTIGLPWQFHDVDKEKSPRLFYFTIWSIITLGVFFILFPFLVEYIL